MQLVAPRVHGLFPVGEVLRNDLREVVGCLSRTLSDFPVETPFCIVDRIDGRDRLVRLGVPSHATGVVACHLLVLRDDSDEVVVLGAGIIECSTGVELVATGFEVLLHHIDIVGVILLNSARITHNQDSKPVKAFGNLTASSNDIVSFLVRRIVPGHEIDNRDVLNCDGFFVVLLHQYN